MLDLPIAIVGAGLSGLRAASLLTAAGEQCVVLEGRDRIGGRILSLDDPTIPSQNMESWRRFDLGATWFWPNRQPRVHALALEYGLPTLHQHSAGAMLVERYRLEGIQKYSSDSPAQEPTLRFVGGVRSLVDAIYQTMLPDVVRLDSTVTSIAHHSASEVILTLMTGTIIRARCVVLALPPRIVARNIDFIPALPDRLLQELLRMPTWVGAQAKTIAIYDKPFWRDLGLSGMASSFLGPLQEIHDASPLNGRGALMGFSGLTPSSRIALGEQRLREQVHAQFERLFPDGSHRPLAMLHKDWAQDPFTATRDDLEPPMGYPAYGVPPASDGLWDGQLLFAGSETADQDPGYIEGALAAAERVAKLLCASS